MVDISNNIKVTKTVKLNRMKISFNQTFRNHADIILDIL